MFLEHLRDALIIRNIALEFDEKMQYGKVFVKIEIFFFEKLIGNGTVCALKRGENLVDCKEVMHLFYGDKNSDEWD